MFAYKLVTQDYESHNKTKWEVGKTVEAVGESNKLCSDGLLHFYTNPAIAVIMNPVHANIHNPKLIQISCSKIIATDGLKYGCKRQTMLKDLKIPKIPTNIKIAFGILCALEVYHTAEFITWANNWLSGKDRLRDAAAAAAAAAATDAATDAYAAIAAAAAADAYAATDAAIAASATAATYFTSQKPLDFNKIIKLAFTYK